MNILFLKSKTFLAEEIPNALSRLRGMSVTVITTPEKIAGESVDSVFQQLKPYLPALVISINNAGYDFGGHLAKLLTEAGSYLANWYTDDPFYETIFYGARVHPSASRVDFVTEPTFVASLRNQGFSAHYLPLATDPHYFPHLEAAEFERDIAFVGSSSLQFMDSVVNESIGNAIQERVSFFQECKHRYDQNPRIDLWEFLRNHEHQWKKGLRVEPEKFLFGMQWMIGYLYRRDAVVALAHAYGTRFTVFGDPYWQKFIDQRRVSTEACYYTNLFRYYATTRINLNLNRIQIRTSFTQRVFDTKACGGFLLTEKRAENGNVFITEGPDREIVEFESIAHCKELIDYFLIHEDERKTIAKRGRDKILANHTYDNRIETILDTCRKGWGI